MSSQARFFQKEKKVKKMKQVVPAKGNRKRLRLACLFIFCAFLRSEAALAGNEYLDMDISQLMQITITSVAKKPQSLSDSPAAVFVITSDDIHRLGITSIPEALRLAPGLQVARVDANKWAITSRGFSGTFANKLLVMIDGRTVYSPVFSGVYWDVQDTLLEDIDRIEVIRGPGATIWGANAVNGVINIITHYCPVKFQIISTGYMYACRGFCNLSL
jgi:iron complex outermembrane receptor protein